MSRNVLVGLCVLAMSACSRQRPPSIVLVTIDTARADALGAYGGRARSRIRLAQTRLAQTSCGFGQELTPMGGAGKGVIDHDERDAEWCKRSGRTFFSA